MCSQAQAHLIAAEMHQRVRQVLAPAQSDAILFGSYARGTQEEGSDIDVMVLVDTPRQQIAEQSWAFGEAAAELLLKYGIVVSPIVENRAYFEGHTDILPFFRNVQREGVKVDG